MVDRAFIDGLASKAPTPGGGGASAYVGVLSAALASMVGNLTIGKKRYADVEAEVQASLGRLARLRARLIGLVDEDARAFAPLAKAYGMPKDTPDELAAKDAAMQKALVGACEVPLEIMRTCAAVVEENGFLAYHGSRIALSDVGVSLAFARAAVAGASLNIFINAKDIADRDQAARFLDEAKGIIRRVDEQAGSLYGYVVDEISS